MWTKSYIVAEELTHKVAILSDDAVVNNEWSKPPIFLQQTVYKLEVIRKLYMVLSEKAAIV